MGIAKQTFSLLKNEAVGWKRLLLARLPICRKKDPFVEKVSTATTLIPEGTTKALILMHEVIKSVCVVYDVVFRDI